MSKSGMTESGMTESGMTESGMTESGMTESGMTESVVSLVVGEWVCEWVYYGQVVDTSNLPSSCTIDLDCF